MQRERPSGARATIVALLFVTASGSAVAAQGDGYFRKNGEDWYEPYEPPPSLPEGIRGIVRPDAHAAVPQRINTLREVFQALQACWRPPGGSGYSGQEITLRLSFKRNGEVLGKPRIAYYKAGTEREQREPFTRSVREAFERCTPFPFTESFGAAIAGRIFAFRFVDARPM
ncbi:MAG TPA: hypothetical protein VFF61_08525 [Microvirga sp.]|nr:hypothetical protein [Microvirga sp.]